MRIEAAVIVPFYGTDDLRRRNYETVCEHLRAGGVESVLTSVSYPDRSPGASRNAGATMIGDNKPDAILLFNDADSLCPHTYITEAIRLAEAAPGLVFAYELYVRLGETESEAVRARGLPALEDFADMEPERLIHHSGSMGCVAIRRECFDALGGFDEHYVGWGYEDLDFARRAGARWPLRRVAGPLFHLWHGERDPDTDAPADSDPMQVRNNAAYFSMAPAR